MAGLSSLMAIADLIGGTSSFVNTIFNAISSSKNYAKGGFKERELNLQEDSFNESLRSNYYSYMQQLSSMEGDYAQNQLGINQNVENIASNQNYLDRWASEYDQSMQSAIDDTYNSYQQLASNFSAGLVSTAEKGQRGGSAQRINEQNALALNSLVGDSSNGFTLQNNRLGSYIQSTALDMLSDKQTAISGVSMAYKSIDSYKDAMKTLQESIGTMKNTTTDLKNTLKEKNLTV